MTLSSSASSVSSTSNSSSSSSGSSSSSSSSIFQQNSLSSTILSSCPSLNTPYFVSVPSATFNTQNVNYQFSNIADHNRSHSNGSPSPVISPPLPLNNDNDDNNVNDNGIANDNDVIGYPNHLQLPAITPVNVISNNNVNINSSNNNNNTRKEDKKASCLTLKSVGGHKRRGEDSMSPIPNPHKFSPHLQPFKGNTTLSSLTLTPTASSSIVSSSAISMAMSTNLPSSNIVTTTNNSSITISTKSSEGPLNINLSNIPTVDWSSMPLFPTQDHRLTFGLGTRQAPVDSEIRQMITLVNISRHRQHFRFCPDSISSPKCVVSVVPLEGKVDPGKEVCVVVTVTVLCTARFTLQIPLVTWRHKGKSIVCANFVSDIESQLTTKLDADELILRVPPVGEGSFGTTYRGEYRGTDVAVKVIKYQKEITKRMVADFKKETDMLEKLRNPCIIGFIGAVHTPGSFAIVTEFAEYGSLSSVIKSRLLGYPQKLKVLLDIAKGMRYLHKSGIIHRDLKPDNVLVVSLEVSSSVMCKLSDFGSTRDVNKFSPELVLTRGVGTPIFMAPELIAGKNDYEMSADVYSFAMTMVNVISDKLPFVGECLDGQWYECVLRGVRPKLVGCVVNDDYLELMKMCWSGIPNERPNFDFIVSAVSQMLQNEMSVFKK